MQATSLILLILIHQISSLRILSVIPTISKSHHASGKRIVLELLSRGHEVVSISPFEETKDSRNYTWVQIEASSMFEAVPNLKEEMEQNFTFFGNQIRLWRMINQFTAYIVKLPKLKNFIDNDDTHFDIVIAEEFFQPIFYHFSYKYKAPLILLSTFGPGHYISHYMGNALELSYVPHEFIDMFGEMSFLQRIKNVVCTIWDLIARRIYSLSYHDNLSKKVFNKLRDLPDLTELESNASLILLNSHYSLTVVRPNLPNIIEIGGVHIEDVKPLNVDLKTILDNAKDGAILFSFGSIVELPVQAKKFVLDILNALGQTKQTVLIKWNSDENLPVKYKNFYNFKWIPQNDVLAHSNVVLFITHGGLLSAQETVHHGVPIICIPFFGDQPLNCRRSVKMGYGIHIEREELTTDVLKEAVKKVVFDSYYKNNVKELSLRFKDRQNSPMDTAIYWIEYCARHRGMNFMKGPRRNLYFYQYYCLDIICLVIGMLCVSIYAIRKLLHNKKGTIVTKVKTKLN